MTAMPTTTNTDLKVRWMIRCDMEEVLDIERLCFDSPWSERDFVRALRQRNCIGMVAEVGEKKNRQILGYMIYKLYKLQIDLTNLAVHPSCWRRGVGRVLIDRLIAKLSPSRRRQITVMVDERNTKAQVFFRGMGFMASSIFPAHFEKPDGSPIAAIHFRFLHEEKHE